MAKSKYQTTEDVDAALDGKYTIVQRTDNMNIDSTTFSRESIVEVGTGESVTLDTIEPLEYEVVFDVDASGSINGIPTDYPTIGEYEQGKRNFFSFQRGTLVIGNFN